MLLPVNAAMMDACVLAALDKEDTYGYRITQQLSQGLGVSESSLYPVLRRLQKDGCLTTYDVAISGRNRRYYRITPRGRQVLATYQEEWVEYKRRIDEILVQMLMYGKEASNRKQEIDRQHYTIPNQRPKDKHVGKSKLLDFPTMPTTAESLPLLISFCIH